MHHYASGGNNSVPTRVGSIRTRVDQGEVDKFSGIADTPVEHSTRLREANDSWIAIKRRLKGGGFVRVEIDGGAP